MRVLIAYGSKAGGTHGLANWLGYDLQELGAFDVDVRDAGMVKTIDSYDAVVIGGAVYGGRWHPDARRFVARFRKQMSGKPAWLFSSGPLDDSALHSSIRPVPFVSKAIQRTGAIGHMTFGGRLAEDTHGMSAGDWRHPGQVKDWACDIAAELSRTVRPRIRLAA